MFVYHKSISNFSKNTVIQIEFDMFIDEEEEKREKKEKERGEI